VEADMTPTRTQHLPAFAPGSFYRDLDDLMPISPSKEPDMSASDRDAACVPNEDPDWDWYSIQWAEHEGRHWVERVNWDGIPGSALRFSGRLLDYSDIEGDGHEMLEIAHAIEHGGCTDYGRCAVETLEDGTVELWSPRNSRGRARVTRRVALGIARSIRGVAPVVEEIEGEVE